ncbi:hypothetical protein ODS41_00115 [Pyrobaculum sp. 3827-6]|uniref:hypothetical protein n=1 Tax=Pyrobaculum sp. 3827-6 TaxID=2983604 RepID=UPI0021D8CE5D|nr:hypothetical protein [Pyrobaculum sp. 3827-6]MCU7786337.1 hypothetical protein [Pyrobaculum sp. 3827-6]
MCVEARPASVEEVAGAEAVDVVAGYHLGQSSPLVVEVGGVKLSLEGALLVVEKGGGGRRARLLPDRYEFRPAAVVETTCFEEVVGAVVKALRGAGLLDVYKIDFGALDALGVRLHDERDAEALLKTLREAENRQLLRAVGTRWRGPAPGVSAVARALAGAGVRPARAVAEIVVALLEEFGVGELERLAARAGEWVRRLREWL